MRDAVIGFIILPHFVNINKSYIPKKFNKDIIRTRRMKREFEIYIMRLLLGLKDMTPGAFASSHTTEPIRFLE